MTGAGSSALGGADRLWPAVVLSLAAHAVAFGLFGLARPRPALDAGQTPIVAKLVRLGEPRPKELLPRKEAAPPPAPEAPPAPAPVEPAPKPRAVAVPAEKAPPKATAAKPGAGRLAGVLSELKHELQAGHPDGSTDGDAAEAGEGDQYLAAVRRELQLRYRLPSTISERDRLFLTGTVVLYIEPDGHVSRSELVKRSGNAAFDEALERAVREAHFPPPPPDRRTSYRSGVNIEFKI